MQISKQRLEDVKKEIAALKDKLQPLELRHNKDKERRDTIARLQKKKEDLQKKLELAEWKMDLAHAADIK